MFCDRANVSGSRRSDSRPSLKIMLIIIFGDTNVMMLGVIQKDGKETPRAKVTGVMVREVAAKAKVSGSVAKERVGASGGAKLLGTLQTRILIPQYIYII